MQLQDIPILKVAQIIRQCVRIVGHPHSRSLDILVASTLMIHLSNWRRPRDDHLILREWY
jgi:hypothetical protein